jgi:hypothetical protein
METTKIIDCPKCNNKIETISFGSGWVGQCSVCGFLYNEDKGKEK